MENRQYYVHGSAARELERPERVRRPGEYERQRQVRRKAPKKRVDRVAVSLTVITFVAVMAITVSFLYIRFQATYLSRSVVELQRDIVEMEKVNKTELQTLESSVNLSDVYNKATKKLGMRPAKGSQVYRYDSKKSTQIHQYSSIPTK